MVKYPFVQFEVSSIEIEAACFLRGDVMVHSTRLVPCSGLFRRRGRHVRSWAKPARDWPARFSGCNATNQGAKKKANTGQRLRELTPVCCRLLSGCLDGSKYYIQVS